MNLEYDISLIRPESIVPKEKILEMTVGQRALLKTESGIENVDFLRSSRYRERVKKELEDKSGNYNFYIINSDYKYRLIIQRTK